MVEPVAGGAGGPDEAGGSAFTALVRRVWRAEICMRPTAVLAVFSVMEPVEVDEKGGYNCQMLVWLCSDEHQR